MPYVTIGGERIHYGAQRAPGAPGAPGAAGPTLLLVHGAGGTYMNWPGELRRLSGYTVLAIDLPGHGASGGTGRRSIAEYVEVVDRFARELALPPFVLAGHSMGGGITLQFALEMPDRLAGIVLVGTGARLRVAPEILTGVQTDLAGTSEKIARWCYSEGATPEALALYAQRTREAGSAVLHADFTACDMFDRMPDVGKVDLPTLIVVGEDDRMTPVKYSQRLHEQIAGSELVVVPGAGHMVMLEQPAAVRDAVRSFLDTLR